MSRQPYARSPEPSRSRSMRSPVVVRSFAKVNLGLSIGVKRADGFHDLRTVYQTIGLHDVIRVTVERGSGIEIRSNDPRVPLNETNTCYRIVERGMAALGATGKISIQIEKKLPVQGGLGGASSNAVASLVALQRALGKQLSGNDRLRIAAEVGSDLPLFLLGGTVLGAGRGEEVYPLPDLPLTPCVVATPEIGVSTPQAFAAWDEMVEGRAPLNAESKQALTRHEENEPGAGQESSVTRADREWTAGGGCRHVSYDAVKLTASEPSDRMNAFSRRLSAWLSGFSGKTSESVTGVPAGGRGRAGSPLLDLVRTGIENDFEKVVFPKHPELREVKCALERAGAFYASLSGSGSSLYGLFRTREAAEKAEARLRNEGISAQATVTLDRRRYWEKIFDC